MSVLIMRNYILVFMIGILFLGCKKDGNDLVISDGSNMIMKAGNQVAVCHTTGNDWNIININMNSWSAHEAHGDAIDKDGDGYFDRECGCSEVDPDDNNPDVNPGAQCVIVTKMISNGAQYNTKCIGYNMGKLTVVQLANFLTVTYDVTSPGWLYTETQLYIGPEPDIPATSEGNPNPGAFPYKTDHTPGVTTYTYGPILIPDSNYVVAAHADVLFELNPSSVDSLCELLPDTVDFIFTGKGPDCYLNIDVFNGFWLNGSYNGWCVNRDYSISDGNIYEDAVVYCSYESLPDSLVNHPENLDLVNWIINHISTGQPSPCGGNYTYGDIQRAVWYLMDDDSTNLFGLGEWSQCRADEIVSRALTNGEGYEPFCGDFLGVILDAEDVQTVLISVPFPCNESFTGGAWGYGHYGEYCDPVGPIGTSFTDSPYYGSDHWGWYFYGCE
jgi:hypothetical protein